MIKIAIDVREACREKRTGKGQWTYGFVSELLNRGEVDVLLFSDSPLPDNWKSVKKVIFPSGLSWHFKVAKALKSITNLDLYLSPTSFIVPAIIGNRIKFIPVVHDLIAFRSEPHDKKAQIVEKCLLKRTLKKASCICTVSENTKSDLLKKYPFIDSTSVTSVFAGPMSDDEVQNIPDNKTILCAGTLSPRKNQLRLIKAYNSLPKHLKEKYQLLLVGGHGWNDKEIINSVKTSDGVIWKGHVSNDEYESLMCTCTVLALPSLYEGFGLQILDALKRGVPILTSNRGSIPELVGDNAVFVDPEDILDMANGLEKILTDESLREDLRKRSQGYSKRFSWAHSVDLFMEAVHNI
ncbi:MAG: glycosyltransferase family 4 protein [Kiritimatiellales bacterium]|nr:glycosyltransferase family 4 protein [Kiritimatiellales bacterium]